MKIQDINFKISFSNDVNTAYKVIQFDKELDVVDYQIDMIRNNDVEGLLSVDARYKDNDLHLYYDITSKQSLGDFIKRVELGKKETLDIIERITHLILQSENYLLDSSCFLINESHIYINPQNMKISLTYLPARIEQNINEAVKSFLIQFVVYNASFKKQETDTVISQILSALKEEQFNLKNFTEKIQKMRQQNRPTLEEHNKMDYKKPKKDKPTSLESMINHKNQPEVAPIKQQYVQKQKSNDIEQMNSVQETTYKTKKRFKKSALLSAGISQAVILFSLVLFGNKVLEAAGKEASSYAGLGIFILAIEGLIFKRIFSLENMEEVQIIDKKSKKNKTKKSKKTVENEIKPMQKNVMMNKKTINHIELQQPLQQKAYKQPSPVSMADETSFLSNTEEGNQYGLDETVLLSSTAVRPYLSRLCASGMERIDLTTPNFVIGRQNGVVNYTIEEQAIGRMHAEFITDNGQYFIKDLNTRNGTFINDRRLIGEQQELLTPGDKIKMANIDFTFNLEQ